ncbi:hypothetical protein FHU36_003516 [Nonomuraea muscovyensis]|uniref:Ig-like domain-containing protein n=1 Tax=Nonomuraea muscovyensis TaxID=1124761 RepID=A0A7X0EZQ6_9ACTN|nr:hypothetical protein [Nonomuraea muscovyensis]MBB6346971.1 hypothetical protein [Nonomuraea muscovyensis]
MSTSPTVTPRSRLLRMSALVVAVSAAALVAGNATRAEAAPPEVISRWNNELVHSNSISPGFSTFLGAGAYTITAKLSAANQGASAIAYTCTISAAGGAATDQAPVTLAPHATQSLSLNVVHHFPSTGQLSFACTKPAGSPTVRMQHIKITAIKVNSVDNQPF